MERNVSSQDVPFSKTRCCSFEFSFSMGWISTGKASTVAMYHRYGVQLETENVAQTFILQFINIYSKYILMCFNTHLVHPHLRNGSRVLRQ
jgi:hypothetical protein